jgi:protein kinase-like protein
VLSKRDLQLVRLAVRWKWFTPEQGEDLLFLKRKFGGKLTLEEIIRRRRYLRDDEIAQLAQKTDELVGARRERPMPRGRTAYPTAASLEPVHKDTSRPTPWDRAPTQAIEVPKEITDAARRRGAGFAQPKILPREEETPFDGAKTIVAPMSESMMQAIAQARARAKARERGEAPPPEGEVDRTAIATQEQIEELRNRLREHQASNDETEEHDGEELRRQARALQRVRVEALEDAQTIAGMPVAELDAEIRSREQQRSRDDLARRARAERDNLIDAGHTVIDQAIFDPREGRREAKGDRSRIPRPRAGIAPSQIPQPVVTDLLPRGAARRGAIPEARFQEESASTLAPVEEGDLDRDLFSGAFGPYFIERVIARGRRGVLYLAKAPDGSAVAIKVFGFDGASARALERFKPQASKVASIESPHVVRLLDYGTIDERPFLALGYVDAWTLEERLDSGDRPDLIESLSIVRDVARGLVAAEAKGVVHRDINPDNVLIGRNGEVLVGGFAFPKEVENLTAPSGQRILGTVGYLAPEQARGEEADHRSDLYALGATLFHLVTGRKTIESNEARSAIHRVLAEPIPNVRSIEPQVPEIVAAVIAKLLSPRPDDRFQSAGELIEVLTRAIDEVQKKGLPRAGESLERTKRTILLQAVAVSATTCMAAIVLPLVLRALDVLSPSSELALQDAFFGALGLFLALTLLLALGLVRRGELPLPMSSAWLVRFQDGSGALGAALLIAGMALGPHAILNVMVSIISIVVLGSWIYGILLRRTIAFLRPDKGVGRMLAVLGDPNLARWRRIHVPLLTTLTGLATLRLAFLAYFASSQSVVS